MREQSAAPCVLRCCAVLCCAVRSGAEGEASSFEFEGTVRYGTVAEPQVRLGVKGGQSKDAHLEEKVYTYWWKKYQYKGKLASSSYASSSSSSYASSSSSSSRLQAVVYLKREENHAAAHLSLSLMSSMVLLPRLALLWEAKGLRASSAGRLCKFPPSLLDGATKERLGICIGICIGSGICISGSETESVSLYPSVCNKLQQEQQRERASESWCGGCLRVNLRP
ncbi:hypothetical protein LY76DRAFT_601869 [Colletotrichum caudatum]|nr:hypothetical protein LY76DRAFT_601869 [Colletotrichum caudatum]